MNERDEKGLAKYQAIVTEYNNKHLGKQQKAKLTALDHAIDLNNKKTRVCKSSDTKQPLQTVK